MMQNTPQSRLISHAVSPEVLDSLMQTIAHRIHQKGDLPHVTVQRQLELLQQLAEFDFGRFLLQHQGINGYWTHYMLTHPWTGRKSGKNNRRHAMSDLEVFLLDRAPSLLATQQRFTIFLRENQKLVKNGRRLACIPCGLMGELLYLDYTGVEMIELVGIDYDVHTLKDAIGLARERGLANCIEMIQRDAWALNCNDKFDLISSNGLTIYEADEKKVTDLYGEFYKALRAGGKLVTSFLTPPSTLSDSCEWDMTKINSEDLLLQRIIMSDIIQAKFQCFRTTEWTKRQLEVSGFSGVQFIYDDARMFPTVVAYK